MGVMKLVVVNVMVEIKYQLAVLPSEIVLKLLGRMCAPKESMVVKTVRPPAPMNICSVRGEVEEMRWMNRAVSKVTGSISGTGGT